MTCLQFDNVDFRFDDNVVFRQLNLRVNSGEIVCVETGVLDGGSSLLKLAAGLCEPDDGNIIIEGLSLRDMTE